MVTHLRVTKTYSKTLQLNMTIKESSRTTQVITATSIWDSTIYFDTGHSVLHWSFWKFLSLHGLPASMIVRWRWWKYHKDQCTRCICLLLMEEVEVGVEMEMFFQVRQLRNSRAKAVTELPLMVFCKWKCTGGGPRCWPSNFSSNKSCSDQLGL